MAGQLRLCAAGVALLRPHSTAELRLLSWRLHHSYPRGLVRCAALGGCSDTYEEEGRERRRRRWRRGRVTENLSTFTRPQSVFRASPLSSRAQSLCNPGRAEWGGLLHPEPLPLSPPGLPCLSPAPDVPTSTRTTKPAVDANVSPRFHLRVNTGSGYLPGILPAPLSWGSAPAPYRCGGATVSTAWLHSGAVHSSPDKKALIEKAVNTLKEKKKKTPAAVKTEVAEVPKPSIPRRVWNEIVHYYHGFRLLILDIKVAIRLLWKSVRGRQLTRRESKQFRRTLADIFRVVPFSVFIVIPFMEFLLPVYIWLFPSAMPSTFQSTSSKEARKKKELQVKLQMAQFLQGTIEEMAVAGKNPKKRETVQEFAEFFEKIRTRGLGASTEEIVRFSKLFEDQLTLDNLSRPQLVALCRLLLLQPIGSSNFLRFQLRMKLRQLETDDKMIEKEGIENLTVPELQAASRDRGMRALGLPVERLRAQLEQWLDLHLNQQIPSSLLLLSRALYLPDHIPPEDALQETLSILPETIVGEAEVMVADTVGEAVDNKTRIKVIRQQEELIREEAQEKEREKVEQDAAAVAETARTASEEMKDTSPIITSSGVVTEPPIAMETRNESISADELRELSHAVSSLKGEGLLEDELEELKEDREEYVEDVAVLVEECGDEEICESKGSVRLGRRVDAMISKVDRTLHRVGKDYVDAEDALEQLQQTQQETITTEQLEAALSALRGASCDAKTRSLVAVLDQDHDGKISLEEMAEVIESLALEDTDIKPEHIAQIKDLIQKEVTVEREAAEKEAAEKDTRAAA